MYHNDRKKYITVTASSLILMRDKSFSRLFSPENIRPKKVTSAKWNVKIVCGGGKGMASERELTMHPDSFVLGYSPRR